MNDPATNESATRRYLTDLLSRFLRPNLTQIDPLLFVGGQFRADEWPTIAALGVRAVLSMQAENVDRFSGTPPDRTLRVAVIDYHAPTIEQLHVAAAFGTAARRDGLPLFVHCRAGVGRAPIAAAACLVAEGHTPAQAIRLIARARTIVMPNTEQLTALHAYAASR